MNTLVCSANSFTFTCMHLADAFIQSDLQCIQHIHLFSVHVFSVMVLPLTALCFSSPYFPTVASEPEVSHIGLLPR